MTFRGLTRGAAPSGPGPVPRTPIGLSGLGAVGGPRGVGAGGLRILVEFLTQYDAEAVKKLESDLARLQTRQKQLSTTLQNQTRDFAAQQAVRTRIDNLREKFTTAELRSIKLITDLRKSGTKDNLNAAAAEEQAFRKVATARGLSKADTTFLINADKNLEKAAERELVLRQRIHKTKQNEKIIAQQQVIAEKQLTGFQQVRANFLPKLAGLGLGALGGIFGGALIGVGFSAAQAGLDAIGNIVQDMIDPARHAREELGGIADAINKIQQAQGVTTLEATKQLLQQLGPLAENLDASILSDAAALDKVNAQLDQANKLLDVQNNLSKLTEEAVNKRTDALNKQSLEQEVNRVKAAQANGELFASIDYGRLAKESEENHAQALREVTGALDDAAASANRLALAQQAEAQSAAFAAVQQRTLADILQTASDLGAKGIQDQLDALSDVGPSARTQALQDRLDALQGSASGLADALKSINEQEALLLFQQKLLTTDVNPNSVTGEFRLAAIDARIDRLNKAKEAEQAQTKAIDDQIAALQKAGDAQDRLNQLLDIQFKLSKPAVRQQGESIGDFITRRAQETRDLLAQQAQLQREDKISVLQAEKDKLQAVIDRHNAEREAEIQKLEAERKATEISVQLAKLAEQRKAAISEAGKQAEIKRIQDALKASQERDRKELEARRKSLQQQLTDEQKFWQRVQTYSDTARIKEIQAAVAFSNTMQQLLTISGEVAGAKFAANQLRQLLASGLVPPAQAPAIYAILKQLDALARSYNNQLSKITGQHIAPGPGSQIGGTQEGLGFASGGVVALNNGSTLFGSNIRTGEQGTELGVILSNKVTQALRETSSAGMSIGEFIINKSDDPLRDRYAFRQVIREELERILR